MHTPEEAIDELDFATKQLGAKVGMFGAWFPRRIPMAQDLDPALGRFAVTYENLGIDSEHNYDFGAGSAAALGIAPTFHAGGRGFGLRSRQLHLQPYRPLRRRRPFDRQGPVPEVA